MATINDLPQVEGLRDFFRGEVYGPIAALLQERGEFGDRGSGLYMESIAILGSANGLIDILYDDGLTAAEKDVRLEALTTELHGRLADLYAQLRG